MSKVFFCIRAGLLLVVCTGHAHGLDVSGFGSFIGGYNKDAAGYLNYTNDDFDYQPDSLAGMQVSGRINGKATATVQLIASGIDNWKVAADWAYVTYQPKSNFYWQLGRVRVPLYLYSENISVGYTYPWISPPNEVYTVPYNSIDGVNLVYSATVGDVDLEFQAYSGGVQFEPNITVLEGVEGESRNQFGFVTQATWSDWTARAAIHQTRLSFDFSGAAYGAAFALLVQSLRNDGYTDVADNLLIEDDRANFAGMALQFDNGRFLGIIEGIYYTAHDSTPIGDNRNFYITAGLREGELQYQLTYGRAKAELPDILGSLPAGSGYYNAVNLAATAFLPQEESWIMGLRWDFAERMAFKSEVVHVPDFQPRVGDVTSKFNLNVFRMGVQTIF